MTVGKIAKWVVNLCDWMNGYHGKMIEEAINGVVMIPILFFFMWFMIIMS